MEQIFDSEDQFVVRSLAGLRNEKFGLQAWVRFAQIMRNAKDTSRI